MDACPSDRTCRKYSNKELQWSAPWSTSNTLLALQRESRRDVQGLNVRLEHSHELHPCAHSCCQGQAHQLVDWCVACGPGSSRSSWEAGAPVFPQEWAAHLLAQALQSLFRKQAVVASSVPLGDCRLTEVTSCWHGGSLAALCRIVDAPAHRKRQGAHPQSLLIVVYALLLSVIA